MYTGNHLGWLLAAASFVILTSCAQPQDIEAVLAKAQQSRQAGNYRAAIIQLKDLLQRSPDQPEARYLLGLMQMEIGDYKSAEQELRRARELGFDPLRVVPAHGRALLVLHEYKQVLDQVRLDVPMSSRVEAELMSMRARALLALGRGSDARDLLAEALQKHPGLPDALLGQALLAASSGRMGEASLKVDEVLAGDAKNIEAWMMKGELAWYAGARAEAITAYQKALSLRPDNIAARGNLARLYILGGSLDEAKKQIEAIRKASPKEPMATYLQALLHYRRNDMASAHTAILQVLKAAPQHMPSIMLAGLIDLGRGSYGQAQNHFQRVLETSPGNLSARRSLIAALLKNGQLSRAAQEVERALKQSPNDVPVLILGGQVFLQMNEFEKAALFFDRVVKVDPNNVDVRIKKGSLLLATGDVDRALIELESAVKLSTERSEADVMLVLAHMQRKDFAAAARAVEKLEEKRPKDALTFNLKGAVFLRMGQADQAKKAFLHALDLDPKYVPAASHLAQMYLRNGDSKAARDLLESIVRKDESNVQAVVVLVELAPQLAADTRQQIEWLERARKSNPTSTDVIVRLGRKYLETGNAQRALELLLSAYNANPDDVEVLDMLGGVQIMVGQKQQAVGTFTKLVSLRPKSAAAHLRLAAAHVANGATQAALESTRRAIDVDPRSPDAYIALVDLEARARRFGAAIEAARLAQKRLPDLPDGFAAEGDLYLAQQRYADALHAYEMAYQKDSGPVVFVKVHSTLMRMGNVKEADARLARWVSERPTSPPVNRIAGEIALQRGDLNKAMRFFETAVAGNPRDATALNNLAWVYQQVKDPRALETAERAHRLNPASALIADTLGGILLERGETRKGIELLEKAVRLQPLSGEFGYRLAQAWLKNGDKAKARIQLERTVAIEGDFPQKKEAQALLSSLN